MSPWLSLVGVVIGGFIAAGTAFLLEEFRRRHQRREKRDDIKREALRRALAWIDPMEKALTAAEVETYALLQSKIDEQEFRQRYPNLVSELAEFDLSLDQRLILDDDPYPLGNGIRKAVEDLRQLAIERWEQTRYPKSSPTLSVVDASYECSMTVEAIRERIDELRQQLAKQYRATLD
jgi:hypothetical protein